MVAFPAHVPSLYVTSSDVEHVQAHDTLTDAVVGAIASVAALTLAGLPDVTIPAGVAPGWVAVRSSTGKLTFADPSTLSTDLVCD